MFIICLSFINYVVSCAQASFIDEMSQEQQNKKQKHKDSREKMTTQAANAASNAQDATEQQLLRNSGVLGLYFLADLASYKFLAP